MSLTSVDMSRLQLELISLMLVKFVWSAKSIGIETPTP